MWIAWPLSWSSSTRLPRPPVLVGREDPWRPGVQGPATSRWSAAQPPMPSVNATGIGGRPGRGRTSYRMPRASGSAPSDAQVVTVQREQAIRAARADRGAATRRRPRSGSPRVRSGPDRARSARPPGCRAGAARTPPATGPPTRRSHRSASRAMRHRSALDRRRRRYGLASRPSPSTTRQTGASASNRRAPRRRVGLGRRAGPGPSADGASRRRPGSSSPRHRSAGRAPPERGRRPAPRPTGRRPRDRRIRSRQTGRGLHRIDPVERPAHVGERPRVLAIERAVIDAAPAAPRSAAAAAGSGAPARSVDPPARIGRRAARPGDDDVAEGGQQLAERLFDRRDVHRHGGYARRAVALSP